MIKNKLDFLGVIISVFLSAVLMNWIPFILKEKFYGSIAILVGLFIYFFGEAVF